MWAVEKVNQRHRKWAYPLAWVLMAFNFTQPAKGALVEPVSFFKSKGAFQFPLRDIEEHFPDPVTRSIVSSSIRGDVQTLRAALSSGGDLNSEGVSKRGANTGFTPLHYAMAAGRPDAVKVLLMEGANPEHRARGIGSPLLFSIILNRPDLLDLLLLFKPIETLTSISQQQLLFESARRSAPDCLVLLLERGVPIDIPDSAGYSLLLRSIDMGQYDLTLWLLRRGASPHFKPEGGPSVLKSISVELHSAPKDGPLYKLLLEVEQFLKVRGLSVQ